MSNFYKLIDRPRYINNTVWKSNNSFVKRGTFDDICKRLFITLPSDFGNIVSGTLRKIDKGCTCLGTHIGTHT